LTPPLPLNKVYYRLGSNPFKSPAWGEEPGLGEGSVIPMNLLQGDLGSAGRADGPGPGKQPFSLMIPNKDKRAGSIGDRPRSPGVTQGCSRASLLTLDHGHSRHPSAAPRLAVTFFWQLPGPLPITPLEDKPRATPTPAPCEGGSWPPAHPRAKKQEKTYNHDN